MNIIPKITLYGANRCRKTRYYKSLFENRKLPYTFYDVEIDEGHAQELRGLYKNGGLNFPTITIGKKKLRNPNEKELDKWITKISSLSKD